MSLLKVFLQILISNAPHVFEMVKASLGTMKDRGHFSEETMDKFIREIQPTKEQEIDQRIDDQVEQEFPEGESSEDVDD
jgi:hypothetical protein